MKKQNRLPILLSGAVLIPLLFPQNSAAKAPSCGAFPAGMLIPVIILSIIAAALYSIISARRRRQALIQLASLNNFSYNESLPRNVEYEFSGSNLFSRKTSSFFSSNSSSKTYNTLSGNLDSLPFFSFEYKYTTGSGKNRQTHIQTVAAFAREAYIFPDFYLQPENILHKIASAFGYQDIDFAEDPEFSKNYLLRGKDENAIRMFFSPSKLASLGRTKGWNAEGCGKWILIYKANIQQKPEFYLSFLHEAKQIFSILSS